VTLLREVTGLLRQHGIRHALIGASALAAHGISRSTLDIDLLTTDPHTLNPDLWIPLTSVDVRRGDSDDPLAGVVRIQAPEHQVVDVVVGKSLWQSRVVERATPIQLDDTEVPLVDVPGLILLKLFAGSPQDAWDVEQLLTASDRTAVISAVNAAIDELPSEARQLWARVAAR
jgi:hypothetical protein